MFTCWHCDKRHTHTHTLSNSMSERQEATDLVVGFLDVFLGGFAGHPQDLIEVLLATGPGAGVKVHCADGVC